VQGRNNPYVRAVGFLYIRFLAPPEQLWDRLQVFLFETSEHTAFTFSSDRTSTISIGTYVQRLLEEKGYFNTVLPRIPVLIQREITRKLLSLT
jgi:pre-mRNA-splicing factor 38B